MERIQRARLASVGVLALVFVTGGLVAIAIEHSALGTAGMGAVPVDEGAAPDEDDGPRGGGGRGRRSPLYTQVGLDGAELEAAEALVREYRDGRDDLERDFRRDVDSIVRASGRVPAFQQAMDSTTAELRRSLRELMSPDQRAAYDSLRLHYDSVEAAEDRGRNGRGRSGNRDN